MIPKGSQRGGGQQLATHLLNAFDNDRIEVAQVRGAIAPDLHGAFAEWRATSRATKCHKYLYSLSLNPDPQQGPLTREQYLDFITRTEKALGLGNQPRAVIFHVKHGREHCHVVWSRIDTERVKAVQISHDHQSLRTVVREFARDHGLALPRSMQKNKGRERYKDRQERESLAEKQQEERSGISKHERLDAITAAWHESRTAKELIGALERRGYLLARGDKRTYVVVDRAGEIHSLARQIRGVKTKELKARLADYPVEKLPEARKAQEFLREQRNQQRRQQQRQAQREAARQMNGRDKARREDLARRHAARRGELEKKKHALEEQHKLERATLLSAQALEKAGVQRRRDAAKPGRLMAFLMRITGFGRLARNRAQRQEAQRRLEHQRQRAALARRHEREMVDFRHREHALSSVEARERRSLETLLRREAFERAAGLVKEAQPEQRRGLLRDYTPTQRATLDRFSRNAGDITRDARTRGPQGALSRVFNDPHKTPEHARSGGKAPGRGRDTLGGRFFDASFSTYGGRAEEQGRKLLEEFRRRARQKEKQRSRDPGLDRDR